MAHGGKVRIGDAARLAGVSKSTLHRALKTGRVSYETDARGERWIDPAEIARAYPDTARHAPEAVQRHAAAQPPDTGLERENALLREMLDDLRRRLDAEADERRRLTLMLTDQRPAPEQPRAVRWWRRWRR